MSKHTTHLHGDLKAVRSGWAGHWRKEIARRRKARKVAHKARLKNR